MLFNRVAILTMLAMIAFAGNSILWRIALKHTGINAASFISIRLVSGAAVLWVIAFLFRSDRTGWGNWVSAFDLFAYAALHGISIQFAEKEPGMPPGSQLRHIADGLFPLILMNFHVFLSADSALAILMFAFPKFHGKMKQEIE